MSSPIVRPRQPGEPRVISNGSPIVVAEGRIGSIMHIPVLVDEGAGYVEKNFEKFVRPPGTRIIAVKDGKMYLQHEARIEKNNVPDWRLPGGKVFDTFKEFAPYIGKEVPLETILEAGQKELREEASFTTKNIRFFLKQDCGATVEWDLYYLVAEDLENHTSNTGRSEGEDIRNGGWFSFAEVLKKCKTGEISEGRSVAALLRFISQ